MVLRILITALVISTSCFGQGFPPEPPNEFDHRKEVLRRGDLVTSTGEFGDDGVCEGFEALGLPEDDSHKWFITLVSIQDCAPCMALKKAIENGKLEQWVNATNESDSWSHYTVRYADDPLQKDWFKGLDAAGLKSFPKILIQPPRSKEYGNPATIACLLSWDPKDKDCTELSKKIRDGIVTYVKAHKKGERPGIGAKQNEEAEQGDPSSHRNPVLPFDPGAKRKLPPLPEEIPTEPDRLTLRRMKELAPDAPPEFYLDSMSSPGMDEEQFELKWLIEKGKRKPNQRDEEPTPDPSEDTPKERKPAGGFLRDATTSIDSVNQLVEWIQKVRDYALIFASTFLLLLAVLAYKAYLYIQDTLVTKEDLNKVTKGFNELLVTLTTKT